MLRQNPQADRPDPARRRLLVFVPALGLGLAGCRGGEDRPARKAGPAASSPPPSTPSAVREDTGRPLPPSSEPSIRVRVDRVDDGRIEFGPASSLFWVTAPGHDYRAAHRGPFRVARTSNGWRLTSVVAGRPAAIALPKADSLTLTAMDGQASPEYRGASLPGVVHLVPSGKADSVQVDVVCHLPIESYLPGVLAGELFTSWRPATHEALAVAARSFALCERYHWLSRRDFDVVADERSQVWRGGTASSRCRDAVSGTRGELLLFRDRVVPGYYSAACGGRPASAIDAISSNPVNAIQPLSISASDQREGCPCRGFGPHGAWRTTFESRDVVEAIRSKAASWGASKSMSSVWPPRIEVLDRTASGRPGRFRVTTFDRSSTAEIDAIELQRALNGRSKGRPVRSADFRTFVERGRLSVSGSGFGHGVGLCQYGSESLARGGASASQILARYYPGTTVRRHW